MLLGIGNGIWYQRYWSIPQALIIFTLPYLTQLFGRPYEALQAMWYVKDNYTKFKPLFTPETHRISDLEMDRVFYWEEKSLLAVVSIHDGLFQCINFVNVGKGQKLDKWSEQIHFGLQSTPYLIQVYLRKVINYFLSDDHDFHVLTREEKDVYLEHFYHQAIRTHKVNSIFE